MAKTETHPWDPVDYLKTREDMVAYLDAALEDGDVKLIAAVLGDITRARGMTRVAEETGLGRESMYKALSSEGNPEFATILKVTQALGFRLRAGVVLFHGAIIGLWGVGLGSLWEWRWV